MARIPWRSVAYGLLSVTFLASRSLGGECQDSGANCTQPCPAANSCSVDFHCPLGKVCLPGECAPSACYCQAPGGSYEWVCQNNCFWQCTDPPVPTVYPSYKLDWLPTLGGGTAVALAVNDMGEICGGADNAQGYRRGCIWRNGVPMELRPLPGHDCSECWGLNNVGQAVGSSSPNCVGYVPVLWDAQSGAPTGLPELGGGAGNGSAYDINDAMQVVGLQEGSGAWLWEDGVLTDLAAEGFLGGVWDISEDGRAVGGAYLWDAGTVVHLGSLGGGTGAYGINSSRSVVGRSDVDPGPVQSFHAFVWQNGVMSDLNDVGPMGGFTAVDAEAINDAQEIIGFAMNGSLGLAFLYDPLRGLRTFNELFGYQGGYYSLDPRGLNNAGIIVGTNGIGAFVMTPIPVIPAVSGRGVMLMALGLSAGALLLARRWAAHLRGASCKSGD